MTEGTTTISLDSWSHGCVAHVYHMGMVKFFLKYYDDALQSFQAALLISGWGKGGSREKVMTKKDAHHVANILVCVGECFLRKENLKSALEAFEGARHAYNIYGNFDGKGNPAHPVRVLNNIAHLNLLLGNVVEMMDAANEAHRLFVERKLTAGSVAIFGEVYPLGILPMHYAPAA